MDFVLNGVSTNVDHGSGNNALKEYKKSVFGAQVGVTFEVGITPVFSLVPELYFMMKGGKLTANNPLTGNETTLRFYTMEIPVSATPPTKATPTSTTQSWRPVISSTRSTVSNRSRKNI